MRIPKTVNIKGKTWTVKLIKNFHKKTGFLGMCQKWKKTITIDADQDRQMQEVTFLHELLHVIFPDNLVGHRTEERMIEAIDEHLHALLHENRLHD